MHHLLIVCGTVAMCLVGSDAAQAQVRDTSAKPNPMTTQQAIVANAPATAPIPACCSIVRIDTDRSIITARETATGFTFRFAVKTRRLLGTLKIGQPVWADFAGKSVKLKATDIAPCCGIVEPQETP